MYKMSEIIRIEKEPPFDAYMKRKPDSCYGCNFDPSYKEQAEGILCKSTKECNNYDQYAKRLTYSAKAFKKSRGKMFD